LKGACDGGLNIPHSESRFVGYTRGKKGEESSLNAEVLRKYIFGGHVADYMRHLMDGDVALYEKQFSRYKAAGITPEKIEQMYADAHAKIRADPKLVKKIAKENVKHTHAHKRKISLKVRKERVKVKKANIAAKLAQQE
jgi:large subunit ribosomal protein L5e